MRATISTIITLLFCTSISFAQVSVRGNVEDTREPLPFATVQLLAIDSSFVQGVVSDMSGAFVLRNVSPGKYIIAISMIGYRTHWTPGLSVEEKDIELPQIMLQDEATQLSEITVTSQKQLIDQRVDKLVINLKERGAASGNSMLEILQRSPGVLVDKQNSTITVNGRKGVRIMLNGKIMQLPPEATIQLLEGMSAANVKSVELISSPSSKYDADGSGGIIHIISNVNEELGTNGGVGIFLGARWAEALGGNFNVSHRKKKFAFYADYSGSRNHNLHIMKMNRSSVGESDHTAISAYSHRENNTTQHNFNSGFEWQLSEKSSLTLLLTGYRRDWELDAKTDHKLLSSVGADDQDRIAITESNIWQSATASLGYKTELTRKSTLSVSGDYLYYHNNNPSTYHNEPLSGDNDQEERSSIRLSKETPIYFVSGSADYKYNISKSLSVEAGFKTVTSRLTNDVIARRTIGKVTQKDPEFSSYSSLDESVIAGYTALNFSRPNKWEFSGGIRYENTNTNIETAGDTDIKRSFGNFFPSVSFRKPFGNDKELQVSYQKRVVRPTFNDIAPYVFFWGPNTFSSGNTALYPSLIDSWSIGFQRRQWVVSAQYTHSKNEIAPMQPGMEGDNLVYRSQNLRWQDMLGISNSFSADITKWWQFQAGLTIQHQWVRAKTMDTSIKLFNVNTNFTTSFKLPKSFSIEVSGTYQSDMLWGISRFLEFGSLNAALQKKIGPHTLRVSIDDILYSSAWGTETKLEELQLDSRFDYDWHNQFVRLAYHYNFGNVKLKSVQFQGGASEEKRRVQ